MATRRMAKKEDPGAFISGAIDERPVHEERAIVSVERHLVFQVTWKRWGESLDHGGRVTY